MSLKPNTATTIPFDVVNFLQTPEDIAAYLTHILNEGDGSDLVEALGHLARSQGMTQVARDSGLGRESLYKALKPGAQPRFETVQKVCRALQLKLVAMPITSA